jgi:DNA-binding IclR family transcriptional regulator
VGEVRTLLELARRTWLAASFGELELHSAEVAAPVFDVDGQCIAAISLAGTAAVFSVPQSLATFVDAVATTAECISRALGYRGPWQSDTRTFLREVSADSAPASRARRAARGSNR